MIVVDNFFENPEEVLELSNQMEYYPFLQGVRTDHIENSFALECLDKVLGLYFPNKTVRVFEYAVVFHKGDPNYICGTPHKDQGLTGIIYLNHGGVPGTSVFKQTDPNPIDTRKERLSALEKKDYSKYNELAEEYLKNFKRTIQVAGEYNRAFIFDGDQFHASDGWGLDEMGKERLTLLVFIRNFEIIE